MVDMDKVQTRVLRGLYAGAGAVATGAIGNMLANQTDSQTAVGAGEVALGAALSVGVDMVFDNPRSMPNDVIEYAGYGIQAVGWDEVAESFDLSTTARASGRTVNLRSNAGSSRATTQAQKERSQAVEPERDFQVDVA